MRNRVAPCPDIKYNREIEVEAKHQMITCKEFENFVQNYLDDSLSDWQRVVSDCHMKMCCECRDYLAAYKRTVELGHAVLSSADDAPVPDDVPDDLVTAILDARKR